MKKRNYPNLKSFLVSASVLIFCAGCCHCLKYNAKNYRDPEYTFIIDPKLDVNKFCDSLKKLFPGKEGIACTRCACDSLVLVQGLDNVTISGQSGEVVASNRVPGQGGGLPGVLSHGRNYIMDDLPPLLKGNIRVKPDSIPFQFTNLNLVSDTTQPPIIIGVMDTGLDLNYIHNSYVYNQNITDGDSCYTGDVHGWNFVNSSANVHDNNPGHHGTFVTELIINQLAGNNFKIMPLKVLDSNNHAELFHFMCAMAYAEKKAIPIINASLGYYGEKDAVLERFLNRLKKKNILLVTSAGNENPDEDGKETRRGTRDVRSLDERESKFYPASYSSEYSNIIAATTSNTDPKISTDQNYSSTFIDVAVVPRLAPYNGYPSPQFIGKYKDEANEMFYLLKGSSFATPVLTGRIVKTAFLSPGQTTLPYVKDTMFFSNTRLDGLENDFGALFSKVRRGYYINE